MYQLAPYQPPSQRRSSVLPYLLSALLLLVAGAFVVQVVTPKATLRPVQRLRVTLATPVAGVPLTGAPATVEDPDIPAGSPLGTVGVVMTQGYGVGSHAPANIWGAVDLAIDSDGDGQADSTGTDGTPIYATQRGTVQITPNSVPAGNHVWVLGKQFKTGYAHLKGFAPGLADGQTVEPGTLLGYVGATGQASGPHLDYQVWQDGVNVNPLDYGALPRSPAATQAAPRTVATDADAAAPVRLVRQQMGGGELVAIIVRLGTSTRIAVVAADGALQSTDATGDTMWADSGQHLRSVRAIAQAPYAQQAGWRLWGGINFGFFGARTSDEGTVVVDRQVRHVNAGRAAVCLMADGGARVGRFDATTIQHCVQAFGAGPVVLVNGKIVGEDLPFNPLDEDFVQADWRKQVYQGRYPKTTIGIGYDATGTFLVLAVSVGASGIEVGRALIALGVTDALGGDDDTSSQMLWNGQIIRDGQPVPDMVAVYTRERT